MFKIFNDLSEIYDRTIIENDGSFICPICNKKAKRRETIEKHLFIKNCHNYRDIFMDTESEKIIYKLYKTLLSIFNNRVRGATLGEFRKHSYYTILAKVFIFCFSNKIPLPLYVNYCLERFLHKVDNPFIAISMGNKETELKDFMVWRRTNGDAEESIKFLNKYHHQLLQDTTFSLRVLERGDIDITTFFENIEFDSFISKLSEPQKVYLEMILNGEHVEL